MIRLTKKSELKTAEWAGGTTTQLAIYPETAEYSKFNFDYRISYATVEVEESTFTFMPGVTRYLMILKGSLGLDHIGRSKKHLDQFDTTVFSGEWPTKAKGKVTDFNLMTKGNTQGKLERLVLKNAFEKIFLDVKDHVGIYLLEGSLQISDDAKELGMQTGDFALLTNANTYFLKPNQECEIIISKILFLQ